MDRPQHYLDESLNAAIQQRCADLSTPTARLLVNLCGAIRSLERQIEAHQQETQRLRSLLNLHGIDTPRQLWECAPQITASTREPVEVNP